ncbi:glycosyltransferase [Actinomadura sediminis]|uniref:Glycosyltransferase n=1 Tax=Actinomadura sediminis TaxID=1038904 RepID=A0ABW3EPY8_9ACTN
MRVLLSTYDSRGGVEPLAALAVRLRGLGAEAVVCAPPDCADRLAEAGVPLVPVGPPARRLAQGERPSAADVPRFARDLVAAQLDGLAAAADAGCDAMVVSGLVPAAVGARSVAEKLGAAAVHVSHCPMFLPSPHQRPAPLPGRPIPPEVTGARELDELSVRNHNAVFGEALNVNRAAAGLPPVGNVRDYMFGDRPFLAADPVLAPWREHAGLDVVQTGAWILPDERPLPDDLEAFLGAGAPPVFVGFGSLPAPADAARTAIGAIRAHGRRVVVGRGWAGLAAIDDRDDCLTVGEVNQQALFGRVAAVVHHGGAGTTTAAARAGAPQVVVPQIGDQPYWARRVDALGIGAAHDGPVPDSASLSAALGKALDPGTRARAEAVAGTVRADGAETAAKLLLDLVENGRT